MHEMSIAVSILDTVEKEARKNNLSKISKVKLKIGEMANIVPEILVSSWEILVKDTMAEDAELDYDLLPLMGKCGECNAEFPIENIVFHCSRCHSPNIKVISGEELNIVYVEGD
jgi:hydrogenase nickel incorporation protein HypA/HybF